MLYCTAQELFTLQSGAQTRGGGISTCSCLRPPLARPASGQNPGQLDIAQVSGKCSCVHVPELQLPQPLVLHSCPLTAPRPPTEETGGRRAGGRQPANLASAQALLPNGNILPLMSH